MLYLVLYVCCKAHMRVFERFLYPYFSLFPHLSIIPYHYQFLRVNMEEMSCHIINLVKYKGCKCYNSRGGPSLRSFVVFPLASLLFFGFIR